MIRTQLLATALVAAPAHAAEPKAKPDAAALLRAELQGAPGLARLHTRGQGAECTGGGNEAIGSEEDAVHRGMLVGLSEVGDAVDDVVHVAFVRLVDVRAVTRGAGAVVKVTVELCGGGGGAA